MWQLRSKIDCEKSRSLRDGACVNLLSALRDDWGDMHKLWRMEALPSVSVGFLKLACAHVVEARAIAFWHLANPTNASRPLALNWITRWNYSSVNRDNISQHDIPANALEMCSLKTRIYRQTNSHIPAVLFINTRRQKQQSDHSTYILSLLSRKMLPALEVYSSRLLLE